MIAVAAEITAITVWIAEICVMTEALWITATNTSTTADAECTAPDVMGSADVITEKIAVAICAAETTESVKK